MSGSNASDQGAVWESVDAMLNDFDVTSETSDMSELYQKRQDLIENYHKHIKLPDKARGALFMSGNKLLGLDLFDSYGTLKKYWKKISESYFIEASWGSNKKAKISSRKVETLRKRLVENILIVQNHVGDGTEFEVKSNDTTGSGVWYDEKVCHMSAFSVVEQNIGI